MFTSIKISGFGGQGVMVIGQLLCQSAITEGKNTTYLPRYGPEKRGGFADCSVMISDSEIGSLMTEKLDCLMALNQDAINRFGDAVKPGGTMIINSALCEIPERDDVGIYTIDAGQVAEELGSPKVTNVVLIGAFLASYDVLAKESIVEAIDVKLGKKPEFLELNRRALDAGAENVVKVK